MAKFRGYTSSQLRQQRIIRNAINRTQRNAQVFQESEVLNNQETTLFDLSMKYGVDFENLTSKQMATLNISDADLKKLEKFKTSQEIINEERKRIAKEEERRYHEVTKEETIERVEKKHEYHEWIENNTDAIYEFEKLHGNVVSGKRGKGAGLIPWNVLVKFRQDVEDFSNRDIKKSTGVFKTFPSS